MTGSRRWEDYGSVSAALGFYARPGDTLIHGDCEFGGADYLAEKYWLEQNIGPIERYSARKGGQFGDWPNRYRLRNQHMVDLGADLIICFAMEWDSGSGQCARMGRKAGIPVIDVGVDTVAPASR